MNSCACLRYCLKKATALEGQFVAFVSEKQKEKAIQILRSEEVSQDACLIGHFISGGAGKVTMKTAIGIERLIDMITGEQLPRIC